MYWRGSGNGGSGGGISRVTTIGGSWACLDCGKEGEWDEKEGLSLTAAKWKFIQDRDSIINLSTNRVLEAFFDYVEMIRDSVKQTICENPVEVTAGADAYVGGGASGNAGFSLNLATLQFRFVSGGQLGSGYGGGVGLNFGTGSTVSGFQKDWSGTLAPDGLISVTVSRGDSGTSVSGGTGPSFGPKFGMWGGRAGKYTSPPTPNVTGACGGG